MKLIELKNRLESDDSQLVLDRILVEARDRVEAGSVDSGGRAYMRESLLYWLEYHDDSISDVEDMRLDEVEAVNAPSIDQQRDLIIWAWDHSFTLEGIEPGDNLDTAVDQAAEALEVAVVQALIDSLGETLEELEGE